MVTLERRGLYTFYYGEYKEKRVIHEALSVFMDGAQFSKKFQDGHWDGYVRYYDKRGGWFWFGLIEYVLDALSKKRYKYELIGYDDKDTDWIQFSDPFLVEERDYQRDSIKSFIERTYGTIKVPTRGGKTFIAAEIIRLLTGYHDDFTTLFLVDNVDLFKQAIDDIAQVTGIPKEEVGRIKGDEFEIGNVSVAMIQTVQSALKGKSSKKSPTKEDMANARSRKRTMSNFLKSLDFMIIDEVQEYGSSKPRLAALRNAKNIQYVLSISATPFKASNQLHQFNIDSFCGGIVYEIEEKTLVDKGVLSKNKMLMLLLEHEQTVLHSVLTYREVYDEIIIHNDQRNSIIVALLTVCHSLDLKTLAMFQSVEHGKIIEETTGYTFLSGEDKEDRRDEVKRRFLSKKGGVLLVSDIWKKGITLPSVEVFLNVDGGKESTLIIQRRGRVLGVTDTKKKALAIDFIDDFSPYLNDHSLNRIKAYEGKLGVENLDVMEVDTGTLVSDLEDYLINWFELNLQ